MSEEKNRNQDNNQSPDIKHLVDGVDGDSLPQLCDQIWENPLNYVEVARYNGLNKFRNLTPGDQLIFLPIIQS